MPRIACWRSSGVVLLRPVDVPSSSPPTRPLPPGCHGSRRPRTASSISSDRYTFGRCRTLRTGEDTIRRLVHPRHTFYSYQPIALSNQHRSSKHHLPDPLASQRPSLPFPTRCPARPKSVVVLSEHPYSALFAKIGKVVAKAFFERGAAAIESGQSLSLFLTTLPRGHMIPAAPA